MSFQSRYRDFIIAVILTFSVMVLVSCHIAREVHETPVTRSKQENIITDSPGQYGHMTDFGERNLKLLAASIKGLKTGADDHGTKLRIVVLGDSHTAADVFTGTLRTRLQERFGNAGIGWLPPMNIRGQRSDLIIQQSTHWRLTSSFRDHSTHYPLSGYIARPDAANASIRFTSRSGDASLQQARFLMRKSGSGQLILRDASGQSLTLQSGMPEGQWGYAAAQVQLPFTLTASSGVATELGGVWLEKVKASGVTVSPIGQNGAQQTLWNRWSEQWLQDLSLSRADMIIIAYGSNEAFNNTLDLNQVRDSLSQGIRRLRSALPHSVILVLGAPDVMSGQAEAPCSQRQPPLLQKIRQTQQEVARQEHSLYWDWSEAMGGDCAIAQWAEEGLARRDLVHLTKPGYIRIANSLYQDLAYFLQ